MNDLSNAADALRDFEFLYGEWIVQGRRVREPLSGCEQWDTFDALQKCRPLLDGLGNVDELVSEEGAAMSATLRFFDARSRCWTIHKEKP